jgi:hypothetical protein
MAAGANFTINHFLTFRDIAVRRKESSEPGLERRPRAGETRMRLRYESVAFFLPAFNEAANLRELVPRIVEYFDDLVRQFMVVIVDDGSTTDDTYAIGEHLAHTYPTHVQVVHHANNNGYGGALKTGIRASLETGHSLIGFCDADQQFEIESFGTLLAALKQQDADLAVGYRLARADSLKRRVMGRGWEWLSALALGFSAARDVDCGFKLFTRTMLKEIAPRLRQDYAAVSPELLARATSAGYRIAEAALTHKPRTRGRQTGSDLKVVLMSLIQLFELRLILRKENGHRRHDDASDSPSRPAAAAR